MRKHRAFTLVELLVVIGIIALLISVLLPALNKAREQSYKTKCLANVRTIGQALSIYAAENRDCVPIGGISTNLDPHVFQLWFTYFAYWYKDSATQKPTGLGRLWNTRILKTTPGAFYCPREDRSGLSFDVREAGTDINPWAFKGDSIAPVTRHTYIGYWVRPTAFFGGAPNDDNGYILEGNFKETTTTLPKGWPKLAKLKSKAIISDIARSPTDVKVRHKDGITVYYANGAAKFVKLADFSKAQGVGKAAVTVPVFIPGSPGPKWSAQQWNEAGGNPGQGTPAANGSFNDTSFGLNTMYLNDTPVFPGGAGLWNWLDRAP